MYQVIVHSYLAAQPLMKHLQFYIVSKVGRQWKAFCRNLGIGEGVIGTAKANNPGDIHEAMMEALHKHSTSDPDHPFTWLSVLNALELLDLTAYAEKLKFVIFRGELDPMKRIA